MGAQSNIFFHLHLLSGSGRPPHPCYGPLHKHREAHRMRPLWTRGRQYKWCRLPQGFQDSSAVFSAVLRDALASWAPPPDCVVISYADDILLSSTTENQCRKGSHMLLEHLATCGFKVSPTKLQWCKPSVTYLGFVLGAGECCLSDDRCSVICDVPPPVTKQAMLSFLGLVNYCRQWALDCSTHDKILRQACAKDSPDKLVWTEPMYHAFRTLKAALCSAPALGLANYGLPFHLYVSENGTTAAGVLAEEHGGNYRPVAYLSKSLDLVIQGMPTCLRAVAACISYWTDMFSHELVPNDIDSFYYHRLLLRIVPSGHPCVLLLLMVG
ncbi:hypothetical protein AOLI_G00136480 [Acnodon oligacanthus]